MTKKKRTKKYQPQTTTRKSANAPLPKAGLKQKLMIGILIFAMLLFVFGSLFKSFSAKKTTANNTNTTTNTIERAEPQFRKDGVLSILPQSPDVEKKQLDIEIVKTPEAIQQGMMYRKSMDKNKGMLFLMEKEEPQVFWMKNTHIPLDIIYIGTNKKIVSIQPNAIPYSEAQLPSRIPAKYVLEVNADYCRENGIQVGDSVDF